MGKLNSYQDLLVWQKSVELCVEIYKLVKLLPKEEMYGLSDQMRRAVVSIPSNIAEGQARNSKKEFVNYLAINIDNSKNSDLINTLNNEIARLNSEIEDYKNKIDESKTEIETYREKIIACNDNISQYTVEIKGREEQIAAVKNTISVLS